MIRRAFWLGLGAALGVAGYRRVTALARSLTGGPRALTGSSRLLSGGSRALTGGPGAPSAPVDGSRALTGGAGRPGGRTAVVPTARGAVSRQARQGTPRSVSVVAGAAAALRFAADVREGMDEYLRRHRGQPPNTLESQQVSSARAQVGAQRGHRPDNAEDGH